MPGGSLDTLSTYCPSPTPKPAKSVRELRFRRTGRHPRGQLGHPRIRLREAELDEQVLALFDCIRIQDKKVCEWFGRVLRTKARENRETSQERIADLNRQLTSLRNQQDRLLNLRLLEEIDESTFASKNRELRDRITQLDVQIEGCDRNRADQAELATKVFELSQTLTEKWLTADVWAKRQLLEITCLNFSLEGENLAIQVRKPFDVLAEGLFVPSSRGDCPSFEPWIVALVDTALSPSAEALVATRVVRLSA